MSALKPTLASMTTDFHTCRMMNGMTSGKLSLLHCTPEHKLESKVLKSMLRGNQL